MYQSRRRLPQRVKVRPHGWMPGEMLVGATVDLPPGNDPTPSVSALREMVAKLLGDIPVERPEPATDAPLLIPGVERESPTLFAHFKLGSPATRVMRQAIARLNAEADRGGFGGAIQLIGATPNWFGAAQQDCCGGSPASLPMRVKPYGSRVRYAPHVAGLDRMPPTPSDAAHAVQVAVLDTAPGIDEVERARKQFLGNRHLLELLDQLDAPVGGLPASALESARVAALRDVNGFHPIELVQPVDVRDHGLFVASVLHAAAPWARLRLVRTLNNFGIGSLRSLVIGLVGVLQLKQRDQALVINLSLGVLPAFEQLAHVWFGFPLEGLPGCPPDPSLQFLSDDPRVSPAELLALIRRGDHRIKAVTERLHAPLRRLMRILRDHNCLVVAAAGNDSVYRGMERSPRWSPRIPAVYDDVLGVAAEARPGAPAPYSNRGELPSAAVRDAAASFGGGLGPDGVRPSSGVIGVYSSDRFPGGVVNDSGWAEWSGTSFATPIMAGVAANLWQTQPALTAEQMLAEINALVRAGGRPDTGDLGVPGVPVRLTWLP